MTMCDCPTNRHESSCIFYDADVDGPTGRTDLHSMTDQEFDAYCLDNGLAVTVPHQSYADWWKQQRTCDHNFDLFTLPTGEHCRASAWSDVPYNDRYLPDVGVYLDSVWYPSDVFGYALGWRDFGEPTMCDFDVVRTARYVYAHIQAGETVEVGCMGGHGRTGSFLAILCLVSTDTNTQRRMSGAAAVRYVRDNHCKLAIENRTQERYIGRIAAMIRRGDA